MQKLIRKYNKITNLKPTKDNYYKFYKNYIEALSNYFEENPDSSVRSYIDLKYEFYYKNRCTTAGLNKLNKVHKESKSEVYEGLACDKFDTETLDSITAALGMSDTSFCKAPVQKPSYKRINLLSGIKALSFILMLFSMVIIQYCLISLVLPAILNTILGVVLGFFMGFFIIKGLPSAYDELYTRSRNKLIKATNMKNAIKYFNSLS